MRRLPSRHGVERYLSTSLPELNPHRPRYLPLFSDVAHHANSRLIRTTFALAEYIRSIHNKEYRMPRPKSERHSSDLDTEIARLEHERKRLIQSEDQRRGAIIRDCLRGPNGAQLRDALRKLVNSRDAFLFGLESPAISSEPGNGPT
jgi:hypothetical protein